MSDDELFDNPDCYGSFYGNAQCYECPHQEECYNDWIHLKADEEAPE